MAEPSDDWTGYDADFLSFSVPLPTPLGDMALRELGYPRFTVLIEPSRQLAVATARSAP